MVKRFTNIVQNTSSKTIYLFIFLSSFLLFLDGVHLLPYLPTNLPNNNRLTRVYMYNKYYPNAGRRSGKKINGFQHLIYAIHINEKSRQPCGETSDEEKWI